MKVAVIHSIYRPYTRGGAEVVVENIVAGIRLANHDSFVITVGYKNELEIIDGIKVYRVKPFNLFNFLDINRQPAWLRLPWHIIDMFNDFQLWRVYKVLTKEKPDLILTHNLKGLGYGIPWLIKIMKIKHVHTVHDMQLIHPTGLLNDKQKVNFLVTIYFWLNKKLFSKVEAVIYPSQYIKTIYDKYSFFPQATKLVMGNPISSSKNISLSEKKCKTNDVINLLFLGQVEAYKGITDLISALSIIKLNFILHIVGDGSLLESLKQSLKGDEKFKFYGHLPQSELAEKIWPLADILINPTKVAESFGMVIIEAMAHGVPPLASNIGAIGELIDEGKTGWLFESGNIDELAHKIDYIAKNICGFDAIRLICQEEAKKFQVEKYISQLLDFSTKY